jgi:hypothetical protein
MGGSINESWLSTQSPFGQLPYSLARQQARQFAKPLTKAFGFQTPGRGFMENMTAGAAAGQPLPQTMMAMRDIVPTALSKSQEIGADIAARAPALYNTMQSQITNYLSSLPNFQSATERAMGRTESLAGQAQQQVSDVTAPGRTAAMFQEFAQPALQMANQQAAARGIAGTGAAQEGVEGLLRNMTADWLAQQGNQISQALTTAGGLNQGIGPLAQLGAGLGQTGIEAAGMGMNALPAYAQMLAQQYNLPMSTASNVLSMLQGSQDPTMKLLQLVAPTVGSESFGMSGGLKGG